MKQAINTTISKVASLCFTIIDEKYKYVSVEVTFGDPRRKCAGIGVCQIIELQHSIKQNCNCKGTKAQASLRQFNEQYLQLTIDENQLSEEQKSRHFSQNTMPLSTGIVLGDGLQKSLNMESTVLLCAGNYAIQQLDHYYHIFIPFQVARNSLFSY